MAFISSNALSGRRSRPPRRRRSGAPVPLVPAGRGVDLVGAQQRVVDPATTAGTELAG
jgi:hypothetical protein